MFIAASVKPAKASRTAPARLTDRIPWKIRGPLSLACGFPCVMPIASLVE
jgi:hypothetical protein